MDQCSPARHPTGHPPLLTNRRGHRLKVGLEKRTWDNTSAHPPAARTPEPAAQRPDAAPLGTLLRPECNCSCGCSRWCSRPCADVRRRANRHVRGATERRRTATNAIMTAWQCGGQGFESPQLHPDDQAALPMGGRPESRLVPAWWPLEPLPCRRSPQCVALPIRSAAPRPRAGRTWL